MDKLWEIFKTIQIIKICNESFCSIKVREKVKKKNNIMLNVNGDFQRHLRNTVMIGNKLAREQESDWLILEVAR